MNKNARSLEIEHWLVARFSFTREQAHQYLGIPHYIETDRFVKQRGLEDHWIIHSPGTVAIHLVYRAGTQSLDVFSSDPNLELVQDELESLFSSFEVEIIEPPELYPSA